MHVTATSQALKPTKLCLFGECGMVVGLYTCRVQIAVDTTGSHRRKNRLKYTMAVAVTRCRNLSRLHTRCMSVGFVRVCGCVQGKTSTWLWLLLLLWLWWWRCLVCTFCKVSMQHLDLWSGKVRHTGVHKVKLLASEPSRPVLTVFQTVRDMFRVSIAPQLPQVT